MSRKYDVYLDDERETPDGWHRCHHVHEVIALLKRKEVRRLSLDHDLGDGEKTGYHLCLYMIENGVWPDEQPTVHSANPVGAHVMREMIARWFGTTFDKAPRPCPVCAAASLDHAYSCSWCGFIIDA